MTSSVPPGKDDGPATIGSASGGGAAEGGGPAKYVPPSMRNAGAKFGGGASSLQELAATQDPRAAAAEDRRTIRVSNLSNETKEADLQVLFDRFGPVSRIFLAKVLHALIAPFLGAPCKALPRSLAHLCSPSLCRRHGDETDLRTGWTGHQPSRFHNLRPTSSGFTGRDELLSVTLFSFCRGRTRSRSSPVASPSSTLCMRRTPRRP